MTQSKYKKYYLVFTFIYEDCDMIEYVTSRKCTDLDYMIDYCFAWIDKFGDKFGECIEIEIYENSHANDFLVYDNVIG